MLKGPTGDVDLFDEIIRLSGWMMESIDYFDRRNCYNEIMKNVEALRIRIDDIKKDNKLYSKKIYELNRKLKNAGE